MGGQKPKTGSNWLLTDPYLQRCNECFDKKKKKKRLIIMNMKMKNRSYRC